MKGVNTAKKRNTAPRMRKRWVRRPPIHSFWMSDLSHMSVDLLDEDVFEGAGSLFQCGDLERRSGQGAKQGALADRLVGKRHFQVAAFRPGLLDGCVRFKRCHERVQ